MSSSRSESPMGDEHGPREAGRNSPSTNIHRATHSGLPVEERKYNKIPTSRLLENSKFAISPNSSSEEELQGLDKRDPRVRQAQDRLWPIPNRTPTEYANNQDLDGKLSSLRIGTPPHAEKLAISKSLDYNNQRDVEAQNVLPAFNKRPLTDTPIVSSVTSPITRDQSSDEEGELGVSKAGTLDEEPVPEFARTKNISELDLAKLNDETQDRHLEKTRSESISPLDTDNGKVRTSLVENDQGAPEDFMRLKIDPAEREHLLQDVPIELQKQFEKTPSLEKLKNLLLTKPPPSARKTYTLNIPGQTSSKTSPDGHIASIDVGSKLVIVMVGLPARGKSYITNKLTRYLNWLQHDCRVFNVGNTRRLDTKNNSGPEKNPLPDTHTPNNEDGSHAEKTSHSADFFSPENQNSTALREKWAMDTLDQLLNYVLDGPGSVGIFDATNSTKQRRSKILRKIKQRSNGELKVLFLESICSDPQIIESNIRLKLSGPDYKNMDPDDALRDFVGRLHNYEKAYETIDDSEEDTPGFQYVKMINVGKKVVSYNIQGFLASQTVYFLLNFNLCERQIWITRHGESIDNLYGRIGGDSHLTERGQKFAKALLRFMEHERKLFRKNQLERFSTRLHLKYKTHSDDKNDAKIDEIPREPNFCVWTSMLCRAIETGQYFDENLFSVKSMRMLNELGGGKFEGMTYEEIAKKFPNEYKARLRNKLTYRYPGVGGESYLDALVRLRPLITEIERTTDHLLIISHRIILRILLAYFLNLDKSAIGELDVPLHTLYCLESKPYGTDYRMYEYDEGLDWFVKVQPEHQKNMKEVGVVFKERKFSVVPTAPPTSSQRLKSRTGSSGIQNQRKDAHFSLRRSLSLGSKSSEGAALQANDPNSMEHQNSLSSRKLADLNRLRKP